MPRSKGPHMQGLKKGERAMLPNREGIVEERPAPYDGLLLTTDEGCVMYLEARAVWEALDILID